MGQYQGSEQHIANARKVSDLGRAAQTANREKRIAAYNLDPRRCLGCQMALSYDDVIKRKKKFCSSSCSAKVANAKRMASGAYHSEETKEKIQEALSDHAKKVREERLKSAGMTLERHCKSCGKIYVPSRRILKSFCCSRKCMIAYNAEKFKNMSEEDREKARERGKLNIKKQMQDGRWKGWSGRGEPSFPEKFVMELLVKDGFAFECEKHCVGFSIDLAFESIKIALEVDGKQHDYKVNAERDRRKESALAEQGWTVVRLRWYSVRTKAGYQRVMEQYENIAAMIKILLEKSSPDQEKNLQKASQQGNMV